MQAFVKLRWGRDQAAPDQAWYYLGQEQRQGAPLEAAPLVGGDGVLRWFATKGTAAAINAAGYRMPGG
jgi:hypothetical protein